MPTSFEDRIAAEASFDPEHLRHVDVARLFRDERLTPLGEGIQARVYRVTGKPWVVKEARWDLKLPLTPTLKVPLLARLTETVTSQAGFRFLPTESFILDQYRQYLTAAEYLGVFPPTYAARHPILGELRTRQLRLRDSLATDLPHILKRHRLGVHDTGAFAPHLRHSFLPREYPLFGPSICTENAGKPTGYIVQQFITGTPLHDVDVESLPPDQRCQISLFLLLLLLLHDESGLVPDTRPRSLLTQSHDWLMKTDNIVVSAQGVIVVDTRWCWDANENLVVRGGPIPEMTLFAARQYLRRLLPRLNRG